MPVVDPATLLIGGALLLLALWLIGRLKRLGSCLIRMILVGAALLLLYALYSRQLVLTP